MPKVKPLSEFNRNQSAIIEELERTHEPIYLTRNGHSSVVVMSSDAFDAMTSFRNRIYAQEMRVYQKLMDGYEAYRDGKFIAADEADARIRAAKGWA